MVKTAEGGEVLDSHQVENTPKAITELIEDHGCRIRLCASTVGIDMLGGMATLLEVMLIDGRLNVVHVPGPAINRARRREPQERPEGRRGDR